MKRVLRASRALVAWLVLTASVFVGGLVHSGTAAADGLNTTYTAHTSVNVRAKASTSSTILGQLQEGQTVVATGPITGDWLPVRYAGKNAFAWAEYLTPDATAATVVTGGPAGRKTVLTTADARAAALPDAAVTATLKKGAVVKVSGLVSGDFTQVTIADPPQWVLTSQLSVATDTTPDTVARHKTTAKLALRASASASAKNLKTIKKGKYVRTTGAHTGGYSQVVYAGKVGWVVTGYLKAVKGTPPEFVLPRAKGKRYVITADIPFRAAADAESAQLATLGLGTLVRITGVGENGFAQLIWDGVAGWTPSEHLATRKPISVAAAPGAISTDLGSDSLNKLEPYGKAAVLEVRANFPQIKTIYGWRSSSSYSEDHPSGRAIDIMIPSYKTNVALGDAVAAYFIANGDRLHVNYIIWRQRNYRLSRGYWVAMSDRGGDTANHYDHVHVSFFAP